MELDSDEWHSVVMTGVGYREELHWVVMEFGSDELVVINGVG